MPPSAVASRRASPSNGRALLVLAVAGRATTPTDEAVVWSQRRRDKGSAGDSGKLLLRAALRAVHPRAGAAARKRWQQLGATQLRTASSRSYAALRDVAATTSRGCPPSTLGNNAPRRRQTSANADDEDAPRAERAALGLGLGLRPRACCARSRRRRRRRERGEDCGRRRDLRRRREPVSASPRRQDRSLVPLIVAARDGEHEDARRLLCALMALDFDTATALPQATSLRDNAEETAPKLR